jgi:signal transduction histidine kinase
MMSRISIRTRLTAVSAAVALVLLAAAMSTVYLLQERDEQARLTAAAQVAAGGLAQVGEADDSGDGGDESGTGRITTYLEHRAASPTLLLVRNPEGTVITSSPGADQLGRFAGLPSGSHSDVTISGQRYVVATIHRQDGLVAVAAIPRSETEAQITRLLRAMLTVGAIALLPTLLLAWWAAGRALAPLSRIAARTSRITGGDMSERVGPVGTHDEVARLADAVDGMLDRLERAFAGQRRLVDDASHELRTPLTIVRGHLEVALLAHPETDADVRAAVELAVAEIDRMARLVDSLLRLARIEDRGLAGERVDVAELAAGSLERARPLADRDWATDLDPAADVSVLGDHDALEQVLLNLLSNAARYTESGGHIEVSTRRVGDHVEITVTDDGEGTQPEALATIFDRFARADDARTRDRGGAGLGLAICREITLAHGGDISAASTPGHGASFTIRLPILTAPAAPLIPTT